MRNRVPHSLEMEMESTRIDVDARVVAGFPLVCDNLSGRAERVKKVGSGLHRIASGESHALLCKPHLLIEVASDRSGRSITPSAHPVILKLSWVLSGAPCLRSSLIQDVLPSKW